MEWKHPGSPRPNKFKVQNENGFILKMKHLRIVMKYLRFKKFKVVKPASKLWPLSYGPEKCVVGRLQAISSNIQCGCILYDTGTVKSYHQAKIPWTADKRCFASA
jgi:hypothetical protein